MSENMNASDNSSVGAGIVNDRKVQYRKVNYKNVNDSSQNSSKKSFNFSFSKKLVNSCKASAKERWEKKNNYSSSILNKLVTGDMDADMSDVS